MDRFDPTDPVEEEIRSSDRRGEALVVASRRRARQRDKQDFVPTNQLFERAFPQWARLPSKSAIDPDAGCGAAFSAGAGLALLDQIFCADPPFAGVLRQRLALRAAAACAALARHREDESALRDAEHLSPSGGDMHTSPAGRMHRLWRAFAARQVRIDAPSLRAAADLLDLPQDLDLEALAKTLRHLVQGEKNPLAAAARAASVTLQALADAPRVDAEILSLWLADHTLAKRLGWETPVPLIATTIAHPALRATSGRRSRPDDPEWPHSCAKAYAFAVQDAYALADELSRRSEKLLMVAPKLRAKGAGRVIKLLLGDDAVSPASIAKAAGLSDRAGRRLFDRLVELGAVRELSGRLSFRLYGL